MVTRRMVAGVLFAGVLAMNVPAQAQDNLKVMVFAGIQNLPLIVAETKGFFKKRGLNVEVLTAPSSDALRNCLAEGIRLCMAVSTMPSPWRKSPKPKFPSLWAATAPGTG